MAETEDPRVEVIAREQAGMNATEEWPDVSEEYVQICRSNAQDYLAAADAVDPVRASVRELLTDLDKHKRLEGDDVDLRTGSGWRKVADYFPAADLP